MSTDVNTQTGQTVPGRTDETSPPAGIRDSAQTLVQESIKYRRRAQEAERRAEALETEIQSLRQGETDRVADLERELTQARTEAESLRGRIEIVEQDRRLERELLRAGCADAETALALAHERLKSAAPANDLAAFAKSLLDEKPHLRGGTVGAGSSSGQSPPSLPPRTAAAKPAGTPARTADRLAEQARSTGSAADLLAYMKARRGA
jgi:hypothetical protein